MKFFDKIRKKLRNRNIFTAIMLVLFAVLLLWLSFFGIGFTRDVEWQVGPRHTNVGIAVPNWLLAGFFLVVALIPLFSAIYHIVDQVKQKDYNKMMDAARAMGDPEQIGTLLQSLSPSKLVIKGELRFNSQVLFYLAGTDVVLIPTKGVQNISTECRKRRNGKDYFLCLAYHDTKTLEIKTKGKELYTLAQQVHDATMGSKK